MMKIELIGNNENIYIFNISMYYKFSIQINHEYDKVNSLLDSLILDIFHNYKNNINYEKIMNYFHHYGLAFRFNDIEINYTYLVSVDMTIDGEYFLGERELYDANGQKYRSKIIPS